MPRRKNASRQTRKLLDRLLESPGSWRHGYELSKETGLKSGTLYPMLIRLEESGLLESAWEPSPEQGRPPRHTYRLTPDGVDFAREQAAAALERQAARQDPATA